MPESAKKPFFDLDFDSLSSEIAEAGLPKFRAKQVWEAVYEKKIFDFAKMSSLPAALRERLKQRYAISAAEPVGGKISADETGKRLFELSGGGFVECVILEAPDDESGGIRKTLCVSTQLGCAQGCKFCASTARGFKRNLSSPEIVSQLLPFAEGGRFAFENIVVMGMGEPLANFDNVMKALHIINARFGFGARRITLSTCGIADKISELASSGFPYRLAVSLHGATNEARDKIMPVNRRFPLEKLIPAVRELAKASGRMVTLEYILIDKINDSFKDADELAKIALSLRAHVNLIPYNTVEGLPWRRPSPQRRKAFFNALKGKNVSCTLRREKGSDIEAACGQLALVTERAKSAENGGEFRP